MAVLYRAMCEKEFTEMMKFKSLSWNSRFKWFGTKEFVTTRVQDGKFNNSKFVGDRYSYLVKFEIDDSFLQIFAKCGRREFMIDRRKAPLVRFSSIEEVI